MYNLAMGVREQIDRLIGKSVMPEPAFRIIFNRAWDRIGKSRLLVAWELIAWSFIAVRLGPDIFGFYTAKFARDAAVWVWLAPIVLSPFLIGPWVYRAHVSGLAQDDSIKTLPIRPATIIRARMAAVGWIWLRVFGPLILFTVRMYCLPDIEKLTRYDVSELVEDFFNIGGASYLYLSRWGLPIEFDEIAIIVLFGFLLIGWFTFPLAWGMYLGTRIGKIAWAYYVTYFLYPLVPVGLAAAIAHSYRLVGYTPRWNYILDHWSFVWTIFVAFIGVLLSILLYHRTVAAFGRRAR